MVNRISGAVAETSAERDDVSGLTKTILNAILLKVGHAANDGVRHGFGDTASVVGMNTVDIAANGQPNQRLIGIGTKEVGQGAVARQ